MFVCLVTRVDDCRSLRRSLRGVENEQRLGAEPRSLRGVEDDSHLSSRGTNWRSRPRVWTQLQLSFPGPEGGFSMDPMMHFS